MQKLGLLHLSLLRVWREKRHSRIYMHETGRGRERGTERESWHSALIIQRLPLLWLFPDLLGRRQLGRLFDRGWALCAPFISNLCLGPKSKLGQMWTGRVKSWQIYNFACLFCLKIKNHGNFNSTLIIRLGRLINFLSWNIKLNITQGRIIF